MPRLDPAGVPPWRGLLALCRVSNLPTVWMNALTAVVLADPPMPASAGTAALLAVALAAFYCGGMALNDVFDAEEDARSQPYRPIPAGLVTKSRARALATLLLLLGPALLLAAPFPTAVIPGLLLLAAIYGYDRYHKAHPATVLLMAACRLLVFAVSAWAVAGAVTPVVLAAGTVQFIYTLSVTLVARWEGRRGRAYSWPVVPNLLAAMALVDGLFLTVVASPLWLLPAAAAAALTRLGQRFVVRGD